MGGNVQGRVEGGLTTLQTKQGHRGPGARKTRKGLTKRMGLITVQNAANAKRVQRMITYIQDPQDTPSAMQQSQLVSDCAQPLHCQNCKTTSQLTTV